MSDGVPRRSPWVALIVGTVLNVINQGDALVALSGINWLKVTLTYCVPNVVCTYGAVASRMARDVHDMKSDKPSHIALN
jgi:hypothetical protein